MRKLVDLRLDGDTESGFRVILTIREEDNFINPAMEITGYLPPSPELVEELQNHWQVKYRNLGAPYRIKPKRITYDGSVNKRVQECKESEQKLRFQLRNWLNHESFIPINNRLREELNREEAIRFLIRTENQQLQKLPWHLWDFFERYRQAEVAFSPVTFERPPKAIKTTGNRVKILAILGHSEGINTEADRQLLESLPNVEITFLVEKTRKEINEQLWAQPWDIIFFAGHSETEGETGRIYINPQESLTIDELWYGLRKAVERGLKIAIFNSCDGLGLAQQLHDVQIPQMIVMRELVPDQVAQEFLKSFLSAFASGQSFYLAVREARERLQGMEGEFPCASWLPVICQNFAEVPPSWNDLLEPEIAPVPRRRRFRKRGLQLLMASMAVTCLVMGLRYFGLLQSLELQTFDNMMQLRADEKRDERLLLVKVTKEDIEQLADQHPLTDSMMLRLLKKLDEYKPSVIGIDIYRDRKEGKGRADLIQYLQKNNHVIPPCAHPEGKHSGIQPPPGLLERENRVGFVDVVKDSDSKIRRHLLALTPSKDSLCPADLSLSFKLASQYLENKGYSYSLPSTDTWKIGNISFKILKTNSGFYQDQRLLQGHQILLNYRAYDSLEGIAKSISISDIINNKVRADWIKDKIILIGVTDTNLAKDEFTTPYDQKIPNYNQEIRGLILHAQMVSQLISAVVNQRPLLWFLPLWGDILCVGTLCLVGGIITWHLGISLKQGLTIVGTIITLTGVCFILLVTNGVVLPLIPSGLALVITSVIVVDMKKITIL